MKTSKLVIFTSLSTAIMALGVFIESVEAQNVCWTSYDPTEARSIARGRFPVGNISFDNRDNNRASKIRLFHPDSDGRVFATWTINPGTFTTLSVENIAINIGGDWGIQVDNSCIRVIGTALRFDEGKYIAKTNVSPINEEGSKNFPLNKSQFTELGDHRRMESNAILSNTGRLDVTTRIWTRNKWSGFTGGVVVRFLDQAGNVVGASDVHSWGVDGLRIPGLPSDRTSNWTDPVPQELLNRTHRLDIIHTTNPKDLKEQVNRAIDITCGGVRKVIGGTSYCPSN